MKIFSLQPYKKQISGNSVFLSGIFGLHFYLLVDFLSTFFLSAKKLTAFIYFVLINTVCCCFNTKQKRSEVHLKAPRRRQVSVAIGTHLCSSKQSPPPNYSKETREIVVGSTLKLQIRSASPSAGFRLCGRTPRKLFLLFSVFIFNNNDVQEAEEGELQWTGQRSRISRRHLFPFVKVGQLQDYGHTEQLLGGLQLQDPGLLGGDAAQKLQKGIATVPFKSLLAECTCKSLFFGR